MEPSSTVSGLETRRALFNTATRFKSPRRFWTYRNPVETTENKTARFAGILNEVRKRASMGISVARVCQKVLAMKVERTPHGKATRSRMARRRKRRMIG
jgi:hypothetical protein